MNKNAKLGMRNTHLCLLLALTAQLCVIDGHLLVGTHEQAIFCWRIVITLSAPVG